MKLTAFFLLAVLLHAGTPALSQRVTIAGKALTLEQVFSEIKKQTGLRFFYQSALLKDTRPVTLNVQQVPVEEVLKSCLQGQGLGFNIRSNTIIIFKEDEPAKKEQAVIDQAAPADTAVHIKGQVVDVAGQPVEMTSVVLARTNAGTQTDRTGIFTLKIKNIQAGDSLNISFIGFRSVRVPLGSKTDLGLIVMQAADNVLDEAMITAYGATSEKFRTGDITTVKAADIEKSPALNVLEALAGRVPGLYVRQNGSNPGSVYNIQLRGTNVIPPTSAMAFGGATEILSKPLIVLDGLPMPPDVVNEIGGHIGVDAMTGMRGAAGGQDPLYWLNTLDVESMTVLKDAEATALYGSRAANGVIMITTKKGKPGKTSLNITFNTGINAQARRLKLLNTQQYLSMRHEAWNNTMRAGLPVLGSAGFSYTPNAANSYDLLVWDTTRYTGWQKLLLGNAPVYNANLALSGGEGRMTYRLAVGYNAFKTSYPHAQGMPPFKEEKGTASFTVTTRSHNSRFKLSAAVTAATLASAQPAENPDDYIFLAPNAPAVFNEKGNLNFPDWRPASVAPAFFTGNPLFILACPYYSNRFSILSRTTLSYELLPALVFTVGAGYLRSDGKQRTIVPAAATDPIVTIFTRMATFGHSNSVGFNVEPNLRYETRIGRHYMSLLAGASYQSDRQEGRTIHASGYTTDELMNTPDGATMVNNNTNILQRKSVGALARISYRYADQYLIDLSARRDGSSSFGPGRRYGNFGSVGWGWIFTRQAWSKKIPLLTFGKIRGSYGITGSQSANPYAWLSTFRASGITGSPMPNLLTHTSNGIYQGIPTLTLTRIANPTLGWAQAASLDLGIDLYLFKEQQLKLSVQWYQKKTGNQLVTTRISRVTGTHEYFSNLPAEVENRGWEAMIDYAPPQRTFGLHWYVHLNIAANRNKLLSYPGLENSIVKDYYEIGKPLAWQQLYQSFLNKVTGTYTISDSIHPIPVRYKVSNTPAFTGGMQAGIAYKGLSLSLSCAFARQKGFTNIQGIAYPGHLANFGHSNQPLSIIQNKHWQSPADSNTGGAFHTGGGSNAFPQDVYWGDASYIALKTAALSYDLPKTLLRKAGIAALSCYIRTENLLLLPLSDYQGANPEQPALDKQLPLRMLFVSGFTINL